MNWIVCTINFRDTALGTEMGWEKMGLDQRWPFLALKSIKTMRTVVILPQMESKIPASSGRGNEFREHSSKDVEKRY